MTAIAERVAAGAAFLDEHDPEWWRADVERAINLEALYLGSGRRCILGQRCPLEAADVERGSDSPYAVNAAAMSGLPATSARLGDWSIARGFEGDPDADAIEDEYVDLTNEWTRVITERRSAS